MLTLKIMIIVTIAFWLLTGFGIFIIKNNISSLPVTDMLIYAKARETMNAVDWAKLLPKNIQKLFIPVGLIWVLAILMTIATIITALVVFLF